MNISYKWLKEYVDTDLTAQEVAAALTSTGLEVDAIEEVESIRGGLRGLVVGEVLTCEPHPNSDHMHVCQVRTAPDAEPQQIVCGAPNVAAGQRVIVATLGTVLYDGDKEFVIKKSKLRGVESLGMLCAEDEIGVGTSHDGIITLPADTPVGRPAAEVYNVESDWLIEIDITANRADALSHYGVARDLYAYLRANGKPATLHRPDCAGFHEPQTATLPITVEIQNTEACPRYSCVSVTGCHVGPSPEWLVRHLETIGLRSINNIVDITNYIMMAYGQPLHCFDADMITGGKIIVKDGNEGREFITLDGEAHTLGAHDLAICNAQEPMCIAGVFGGKGSGTYETTTNVVFESATFHPTWIRKSARRHGLSTDASFRFERGTDPEGTIYALKQAAILAAELAGGTVAMPICDVYPKPKQRPQFRLEYQYITGLIGKDIPHDTIKSILTSLEIDILDSDDSGLLVQVPLYRVDVTRPCDVVEDVLRIYGYNNVEIPTQLNSTLTQPSADDRRHHLTNLVAEQLVGAGFNEILCNSLTRAAYYNGLNQYPAEALVTLVNPLSSDLNAMRQTLLFGGLETIRRNINRRAADLRLFETGNCYHYNRDRWDADAPMRAYKEETHLALWLTGKRTRGSWAVADTDMGFYDLRAHVANVLARIGLPQTALVEQPADDNIFASALAIKTRRDGKLVAVLGTVAKALTHAADIEQPVFFADINWALATSLVAKVDTLYHDIPRYPAVSRDLALMLDTAVPFADIERVARQAEKKHLTRIELFDVYEGDRLPAGKKSYAVNFTLQDTERTMSDKQITATMDRIIAALRKELKAELR